ncbi:hypothetical protein NP233_g821 [Leucocoprinus birnbaumii]|uniref:Peptidase M43 pregnancy-associated plasma-A domain-containing protein n=1 Tax=Leucocoprinus birnbaumii TaxID=56174 RepID=A0AAD5W3U5_9AGAR|nr:hypothetical protein NP233_g821 [Leucocoprinus birnbaumii]
MFVQQLNLSDVACGSRILDPLMILIVCGTEVAHEKAEKFEKRFVGLRKRQVVTLQPRCFDVHWTVITANETLEGGWISPEMMDSQIDVLNRDYTQAQISWRLTGYQYVHNPDWFENAGEDTEQSKQMKYRFRSGGATTMNLYTIGFNTSTEALGYATMPQWFPGEPISDGVVIKHTTVPGGSQIGYNTGKTLTHESGHWLGLYHTFRGGCSGSGDFVDDTPAEAEPSKGCPIGRKTCPGSPGEDPIPGRPPFATDEPDSFYESAPAPQRRVRQPAPPNPNARTSAYNVYDNYLGAEDSQTDLAANRQSGIGALGAGLMNLSDSDDSDDEGPARRPAPPPPSKNAALAAATAPPRSSSKHVMNPDPPAKIPEIVAPRPGYAAPIAALNLARPENATTRAPPPKPITVPTLENPFEPPMAQVYNPHGGFMPNSPSPSGPPSSPHPLQPSITPITPVFARPAKNGVSFSEPIPRSKPIMRSGTEDALPGRRGEKGDDFWRRFSMVAKIENSRGAKESWWLKKTQSGTTRLSRWVWVVAIVLIVCIVAASIIGWQVSKNKPNHSAPTAFGGQGNARPSEATSTAAAGGGGGASSTIKHVSPTYTVQRRDAYEPIATGIPIGHSRALERRRRLFDSVIGH